MFINYTQQAPEYDPFAWKVEVDDMDKTMKQLVASNFQDTFTMTKRVGEIETKMNNINFRAQGIGGMIGIAAGAMGGPMGSIFGFGVGRAIGGFVGNALGKKYYGEEQAMVNEHLFIARMRDTQLKNQIGDLNGYSALLDTFISNKVADEKKLIQDMMVL